MTSMDSTEPGIDERQTDEVIYRVAVAAFTYYADKADVEPGYRVDEDIDWAIQPVHGLDPLELAALRERVRAAITDPTIDRQAFIREVTTLART
ncbi:hypothetical protein P0L94_15760 [Microbacter sp. GSS18]|nr:hypothetical protein P0L94_15760 [Microbacter sp. GSS18]